MVIAFEWGRESCGSKIFYDENSEFVIRGLSYGVGFWMFHRLAR